MEFISFRFHGRIGHFLKAEAGASALSYMLPPRTVILGMLGAVLGLEKDRPQNILEPAMIAVAGKIPITFWHRIKLRKEDPEYLPQVISKKQKASESGKEAKPTLILQQWLFEPDYTLWVYLPEPFHAELRERLIKRRWHFQPGMGLSEMMAELVYADTADASPLSQGLHHVSTVFPKKSGNPDTERMFTEKLCLNMMRMPCAVTGERVFTHRDYYMEKDARPVPVKTDQAFQWKDQKIICL